MAKAPGYAVFTTYGISFLLGGAGGKGLVHDNKTKKNTYMEMGSASVGAQIGASENDVLIVFKTAAVMNDFVNKGWDGQRRRHGTGRRGQQEGVAAAVAATQWTMSHTFTLTKNGLEAGLSIGGVKALEGRRPELTRSTRTAGLQAVQRLVSKGGFYEPPFFMSAWLRRWVAQALQHLRDLRVAGPQRCSRLGRGQRLVALARLRVQHRQRIGHGRVGGIDSLRLQQCGFGRLGLAQLLQRESVVVVHARALRQQLGGLGQRLRRLRAGAAPRPAAGPANTAARPAAAGAAGRRAIRARHRHDASARCRTAPGWRAPA